MLVQNWTDVVISSLQGVWAQVISFLPALIGALVVFIVGLIIAGALRSLVERGIRFLKVDAALSKLGVQPYFERANLRMDSGRFFGQLVFWFLVIAFFLAASDILGFFALSAFLRDVLLYIPNILIAVLILLATVVVANFLRGLVKASVMGAKLHAGKFLASLTWWVTVVFGFLTALVQLGIGIAIIQTLVTGFIAMLAIAGGLAFGLGGKDYAAHLVDKMRKQME